MRPSHRSRTRRHHPVRRAIAFIVVIVIIAWCVFAARFLWFPHVDKQPAHVDAIVQLGGPHGGVETYEATRNLARDYTTNLVISDPYTEKPDLGARICAPEPGVAVYCIHPDPSTTRGEAQAIKALAEEHGWSHIMVYATGKYHVARARMIIGRCYDGDLNVGYHKTPLNWKDVIWEWAYQTGGVAKVLVQRGC